MLAPGAHVQALAGGDHVEADAGADADAVEIFQQFPVAFEQADDYQPLAGARLFQRLEAALPACRGGIHADDIAMRASAARAQPFRQFALEIGGHGMFQVLRLVVHLVPFQAEDFGQHAFDEVMAVQQAAGDLAAGAA